MFEQVHLFLVTAVSNQGFSAEVVLIRKRPAFFGGPFFEAIMLLI